MPDIVTIDGPASSGKTSVGQALAKKLGYQFIDSGQIYRAGGYKILNLGIDLTNNQTLAMAFHNLNVQFKNSGTQTQVFLDNQDVTEQLHEPEITQIVPTIAAIKEVREEAKILQRQIGTSQDTVMAGRDIGTEIFPEANHKFFLTASPDVRARRRMEQLKQKDPTITFVKVYTDMMARDDQDANREISPMRIPEGAVVIDNTNKSVDETVEEMLRYYRHPESHPDK